MKKILASMTIGIWLFVPSLGYSTELRLIDLTSKPLEVKKPQIIDVANNLMYSAIYWEDEGYEYKMKGRAFDLVMVKLWKNVESKEVAKLELAGSAYSAGYGWFSGYRSGISHCRITLFKNNEGDWSAESGDADCETEFNDWD